MFAAASAVWMLVAATVTEGITGIKGAGMTAVEFSGCYFIFRYWLHSIDSSVRIVRFACKVVVVVIAVALLDPLTGRIFSYEVVKSLTGYSKPDLEFAFANQGDTLFRDGLIRAMGPMEHSILFGCVCVWFGTIAFWTFRNNLSGWFVAGLAAVGLWFSQARGTWVAYIIALTLLMYYYATPGFRQRWKVIGAATAALLIAVFTLSGSPIATLMKLGGLSPEAAYYRQQIWAAAWPLVERSPFFGIGLIWPWQDLDLAGPSVDAFWLQNSMTFGIPASLLVALTMISPYWQGSRDSSPFLSVQERRLSAALGIVTVTAVFLGFTVHFWGICWILLGAFAGLRAHLAEAPYLRSSPEI